VDPRSECCGPRLLGWLVLAVILAARVWLGGRIAWAFLFVINILILAGLIILAPVWTAYDAALIVFWVAQTAILLAPAVRRNVSRGQIWSKS
jgi:hypothetical protein